MESTTLNFLNGVIAPMLTPCRSNGSLDLDGVRGMVGWWKTRRGLNTIFARSGMGKMFSFTVEETLSLARAVRADAAGRFGVLVGAAGEWLTYREGTRPDRNTYLTQAIYLTVELERVGVDGAVHVVPYALEPAGGETTQDLIFHYYQQVHDAASIPIVIYQPHSTPPEYRIRPRLLERLLKLPRLAGIKVSTMGDEDFLPLAAVAAGAPFALICGDENQYLKALKHGAVGVIGEGCNVYPEILADLKTDFERGDLDEAERHQLNVGRGLDLVSGLNSAVAWRQLMIRLDAKLQPYDREPFTPYPQNTIERLATGWRALLSGY